MIGKVKSRSFLKTFGKYCFSEHKHKIVRQNIALGRLPNYLLRLNSSVCFSPSAISVDRSSYFLLCFFHIYCLRFNRLIDLSIFLVSQLGLL